MRTFAQHTRLRPTTSVDVHAPRPATSVISGDMPRERQSDDCEAAHTATATAPLLLLFASHTDGQSRRVEGFIAHALQRRGNHHAFRVRLIDQDARPDLFERFDVSAVPTVLVVDDQHVVRRMAGNVRPHDLEEQLGAWLK